MLAKKQPWSFIAYTSPFPQQEEHDKYTETSSIQTCTQMFLPL